MFLDTVFIKEDPQSINDFYSLSQFIKEYRKGKEAMWISMVKKCFIKDYEDNNTLYYFHNLIKNENISLYCIEEGLQQGKCYVRSKYNINININDILRYYNYGG